MTSFTQPSQIPYSTLPKVQLHIHLDGSLTPSFFQWLTTERDPPITLPPTFTKENIRSKLMEMKSAQVSNGNRQTLNSNWSVFDWCNQYLQTYTDIKMASYLLTKDLASEHNVRILELRFCPYLHTLKGLTADDAVNAAMEGMSMHGNTLCTSLILTCVRSRGLEEGMKIARLSKLRKCGFDVAGDEGSYGIGMYMDVIRYAREEGVKVTVHAGEWPVEFDYKGGMNCLENLDMLLLGEGGVMVDRIGHGTFMSPEHVRACVENGVTVECCITSNCGWKVSCYSSHPCPYFLRSGVTVTLNVDNTLLSGNELTGAPTPTGECVRYVEDVCGGMNVGDGMRELARIQLNGVDGCFEAAERVRGDFRREVVEWLGGELRDEIEVVEAAYGDEVMICLPYFERTCKGGIVIRVKVEVIEIYPLKGVGIEVRGGDDKGLGKALREKAEEGKREGRGVIFEIFNLCDEWEGVGGTEGFDIDDDGHGNCGVKGGCNDTNDNDDDDDLEVPARTIHVRVVKSHHIIAPKKIKDIRALYKNLGLTGVVKLGWPGVIVVEGFKEDVGSFIDCIEQWAWQHIECGLWEHERSERIYGKLRVLEANEPKAMRKLKDFMAEAGENKEAFGALLKGGGKNGLDDNNVDGRRRVKVTLDHMRDRKKYRSWIKGTCKSEGVEFEEMGDGLVWVLEGEGGNVEDVIRAWKSEKVDVNSKGEPCKERMADFEEL